MKKTNNLNSFEWFNNLIDRAMSGEFNQVIMNDDFSIKIPDELIKKLNWKKNDKLVIDYTEISFDEYDGSGIVIYKIK